MDIAFGISILAILKRKILAVSLTSPYRLAKLPKKLRHHRVNSSVRVECRFYSVTISASLESLQKMLNIRTEINRGYH